MNPDLEVGYLAFDGDHCIGAGDLRKVISAVKALLDRRNDASILIFETTTGDQVEVDWRGSLADVLARLPEAAGLVAPARETEYSAVAVPRGPGRPKLGVVAREITLLPRHWEWLARQTGGASVAIRKLVEDARRGGEQMDRARLAQETAYRFLSVIAGNKPHYEDAIRALFAGNAVVFEKLTAEWPRDVRDHSRKLASKAFGLTAKAQDD